MEVLGDPGVQRGGRFIKEKSHPGWKGWRMERSDSLSLHT